MKKSIENTSYDLFTTSPLEERQIKKELYTKLLLAKQKNKQKDAELDTLKKRSNQLKTLKQEYSQKIILQEQILKKSNNHLMVLRENLKKIYLEFIYLSQDPVDIDNMTYEELLELQEQVGHVSKGLTTEQLSKLRREVFIQNVTEQSSCSVCQQQFESGSSLIILKCSHAFHQQCISEWFKKQKVCPLCKTESI